MGWTSGGFVGLGGGWVWETRQRGRCSSRAVVACSRVAPKEMISVKKALERLEVSGFPEPLRFSANWRGMIEELEGLGLTGTRLENLLERRPGLLEMDPKETILPFVRTVTTILDFDSKGASIMLCRRPSLIDYPELAVAEILYLLLSLGVEEKPLRFLILRFPGIAELNPSHVKLVFSVLARMGGFEAKELWNLIRSSPWALCYSVETEIMPVIKFLMSIDVSKIKLVIQTEPRVFGCSVSDQLEPVYNFLLSIGLTRDEIAPLVQLFPSVLIASIEEKLRPNYKYLRSLGMTKLEVAQAVRAFPVLLVMDIEEEMQPVVHFLESKGIENTASLVSRLPAVLGYDVQLNLKPKFNLLDRAGLDTIQILDDFPGYLGFSLDDIIIPRILYLRSRAIDLENLRLSSILACGDAHFCERYATCTVQEYQAFRNDLADRRGMGEQAGIRKRGRRKKVMRKFPTRCRYPIADLWPQH